MRLFAELYRALDESNRTSEKVAALEAYFRSAPPRDAAWALYLLTGNKLPRPINSTELRLLVAETTGLPLWMVEECYGAVGDFSETVALLLGDGPGLDRPLHALIEEDLLPMKGLPDTERRQRLVAVWRSLSAPQRFVWQKLMSGSFRVGVSRTLVTRALAQVAGIPQSEMAHRLMGNWSPTEEDFLAILGGSRSAEADITRPYPFALASPLEDEPSSLGPGEQWQAEWKWDGIRSQLIRRAATTLIWSRGEELITDRFPEIAHAAARLPNGTVLDGEILCWSDNAPMPFQVLQQRIGRKKLSRKLLEEAPVAFLAYDLLEHGGEDWRLRPLNERRAALENILAALASPKLLPSPLIEVADWEQRAALREESRARGVEGLMLKRGSSPYHVGRVRGDWWKWKIEPFTIDAVMVNAMRGSGRRASLYTDYTFALWRDGALVPIAKAYSGLTDAEIRRVDQWIRKNTLERHGPVRVVRPELVFELAFEGIQPSTRHKSGLAVRFPRIARWREDKRPEDADTLENLRRLGGL